VVSSWWPGFVSDTVNLLSVPQFPGGKKIMKKWIIGLVCVGMLASAFTLQAQAQASSQTFGTGTGTHTSQTGSTGFIPNPTGSGTTWVRAGATAPAAPIVLATAGNPLGTSGAYVQAAASASTSVGKFSPMVAYTGSPEFYTSFKILLGDAAAGTTATNGSWTFYQGAGSMYSDASDFAGAAVFTGVRFTFNAAGGVFLGYRGGAAWTTTGLSGTNFNQAPSMRWKSSATTKPAEPSHTPTRARSNRSPCRNSTCSSTARFSG
jgi:hypothetical protein